MVERVMIRRKGGAIVGGVLLLFGLYITSRYSYLLFHTLIEMFTVVVTSGVFVIAWNARASLHNNYLLLVGVASIFVALVDLLHAIAYEGMGVFPRFGSDLPTQLWLAGRWIQALALFAAPFFLGRRLRVSTVATAFGLLTAVFLVAIFQGRVFPTAFADGVGLTSFKKVSEYAISLVLLAATALLWRKREAFDPWVWRLLTASLVLTIASELTFTFYLTVYGETNLVGHFLRLLAFYALYKAVIETGLVRPQAILLRDLRHSQEQLRAHADTLERRNDELRRSERQLRDQAFTLTQRNQELDAFAHTVAHDLKNPLAVIVTNTEMVIESDTLAAERKRTLLHRIRSTADKMNRIINALLLLSKVRRIEAPRELVHMDRIVDRVRDGLSEMIASADARLTLPDHWPAAQGFAPWIEEIWANYLSNALRYGRSAPGHPPEIELGADPQQDGTVRFWVRDHGPGVPPEARSDLFAPFTQLGKVSGPRTGHGLGLSIVVQLVEKLGGSAGMEDAPGGGSLFYFTLPAASSPEAAPTHAGR